MLKKRLSALLHTLPSHNIPASELWVQKNGETLFHECVGYKDAAQTLPASESDLYYLYSSSKIMTVTAALILVEEGKLSLDDPVATYLPAYADIRVKEKDGSLRAPKTVLLVRHLFTMCGGFDYNTAAEEILAYTKDHPSASTLAVLNAYAKHPIQFDPGTHYSYSMCHDVLAGVVEVASGMRFSDFVQERICRPLGISDLYYHLNAEGVRERMSTEYRMNADLSLTDVCLENSFIITPDYESGGAGVITTGKEYVTFLSALAMGGRNEKGRICKKETVALLQEDHMDPVTQEDYDSTMGNRDGYGYGLGVRVHVGEGSVNHTSSSIGEFGWGGAAGSYSLVDPETGIAIFYLQHVLSLRGFEYDTHPHNAIREIVYEEYRKGNL